MTTASLVTQPSSAGTSTRRRRALCFALLTLTLPVGLVWRVAPLHLPPFAFKYGGSGLWAIAVYWVVAIIWPRWSASRLAVAAGITALAVELFKKVYWPPLDHFRESVAGKLLLGRYFSYGAIVAYWVAIAAVAWLDRRFLPSAARSRSPNARFGVLG